MRDRAAGTKRRLDQTAPRWEQEQTGLSRWRKVRSPGTRRSRTAATQPPAADMVGAALGQVPVAHASVGGSGAGRCSHGPHYQPRTAHHLEPAGSLRSHNTHRVGHGLAARPGGQCAKNHAVSPPKGAPPTQACVRRLGGHEGCPPCECSVGFWLQRFPAPACSRRCADQQPAARRSSHRTR